MSKNVNEVQQCVYELRKTPLNTLLFSQHIFSNEETSKALSFLKSEMPDHIRHFA